MARRALAPIALLFVAVLATGPVSRAQEPLGRIDFPTSQTGDAQSAFLKGVLLLHSFEYDDAREAFVEAEKAAPGFAMAYWGEAMTHNHPLWAQTAPDLAREALSRLAPTAGERQAKAANDKERDWLRAVEALYADGEKPARDTAYAAQMRRMHDKYPDDLEVTAFFALATLGASPGGRDAATYMRAAALVEDVYSQEPRAPRRGALSDSRLRRPHSRAARTALRGGLREDRPGRVACPAHALAHLLRPRDVGQGRRDERALGEGGG